MIACCRRNSVFLAERCCQQTSSLHRLHRNSIIRLVSSDRVEQLASLERYLKPPPVNPDILALDEDDEEDFDPLNYEEDEEEDQVADPRLKFGKTLLKLGRVQYRHQEALSERFLQKQKDICKYRTSAQLKRCLQNSKLNNYQHTLQLKYKDKRLGWLTAATTPTQQRDNTVIYGVEETLAYSQFFMPARYGSLTRVLKELQRLMPSFAPVSVLDFGCGPGTAALAIMDVFQQNSMGKYTGVDMSTSMLDAAKISLKDSQVDYTFYSSIKEVVQRAEGIGIPGGKSERYDLVVVSFTLTELPSDSARIAALQLLYECVNEGGVLVLLEQGSPYGSHTVRTARQFILDTYNPVTMTEEELALQEEEQNSKYGKKNNKSNSGEGGSWKDKTVVGSSEPFGFSKSNLDNDEQKPTTTFSSLSAREKVRMSPVLGPPTGFLHDQLVALTVAPCTHDKPCPLAEGVWCSFPQQVYDGVKRKSTDEKLAYVVMQKRSKGIPYTTGQAPLTSNSKYADNRSGYGYAAKNKKSKRSRNPVEAVEDRLLDSNSQDNWSNGVISGAIKRLSSLEAKSSVTPSPLEILQEYMALGDASEAQQLTQQYTDQMSNDWSSYTPPLYREDWGRVLRSPLKSKGQVMIDICTPKGLVTRHTTTKARLHDIPSLYTALRKTSWGGLHPILTINDQEYSPLFKTKHQQNNKHQMTTPSPFGLNRKAHMGVKQTPKSQDSEESNDDEYFDDAGLVDGDYQYGGNDDYQYDDEDMLMYRDEFGARQDENAASGFNYGNDDDEIDDNFLARLSAHNRREAGSAAAERPRFGRQDHSRSMEEFGDDPMAGESPPPISPRRQRQQARRLRQREMLNEDAHDGDHHVPNPPTTSDGEPVDSQFRQEFDAFTQTGSMDMLGVKRLMSQLKLDQTTGPGGALGQAMSDMGTGLTGGTPQKGRILRRSSVSRRNRSNSKGSNAKD